MPEALLTLQGIGKRFFGAPVLQDIQLEIFPGEILGLVGENGAGKSTLMNILGGVHQPEQGAMRWGGDPYQPRNPADAKHRGIAFIHQELNLFPNLSILDNLCIDGFPRRGPFIDRRAAARHAQAAIQSLGLTRPVTELVEKLSPGERQLVEISRALAGGGRLVIFDEPTTSLTDRETRRLFEIINRLRADGLSMIYISHQLDHVLELADRVAVLKDGRLVAVEPKAGLTTRRMIRHMAGRDLEQLFPPPIGKPGGKVVLEVERLDSAGLVRDVSFAVRGGEIVGLFGLMGAGRSELAQLIFGLEHADSGAVRINGSAIKRPSARRSIEQSLAFVTENRREEGLLMQASVAESMALVQLPGFARRDPLRSIDRKRLGGALADWQEKLRIKACDIHSQPVATLSGGNQQKVVLAKWLLGGPSAIILDEPTRGIDVGAKYEVYRLVRELAAAGTAILLISSELEELIGLADRILVMRGGALTGSFPGSQYSSEEILAAAFGIRPERAQPEAAV